MPPVGFEPAISAGERRKAYALDRATTGTGITFPIKLQFHNYTLYQFITDFELHKQQLPHVFSNNDFTTQRPTAYVILIIIIFYITGNGKVGRIEN